jgi:lipid-binding SYLF domain-containing protein
MKRIAILWALLMFATCAILAQDSSSSTTTSSDGNTTTTTTSTTNNQDGSQATTTSSDDQQKANNKAAARTAEAGEDQHKDNAKNANSKLDESREKALARVDESTKILDELLAASDKGIPDQVFKNAKCVAIVPSMIKGGFVFGAEHGKGVATCRTPNGWSAPAFFTITGGSWGAQIGGQAVDLVMLFMTDDGAKKLLDAKFNLGGDASVAAGPVGRDASANTDWKFKTGVLTYSRARGIFAGISLKGAVIRQDDDSTMAVYGKNVSFRQILSGKVPPPHETAIQRLLATVRRDKAEAAAAH